MTMIQKLQKISAKLFQESLKTYHFKDLVIHRKIPYKSLVQMCALYPNKGVGFSVWRKGWPKTMHIKISEAMLKSNRHGKLRGIKYFRGKPLDQMPKHFNGASKRGIWQYSVEQANPVELDNGLIYTTADYKAFYQMRRSWHQQSPCHSGDKEKGQDQSTVEQNQKTSQPRKS